MTIIWSFSYNSFVKFHVEKIWEPHDCYIQIIVINWCVVKELHCMWQGLKNMLDISSIAFRMIKPYKNFRVPKSSGNHGKPGKSGKNVTCMENHGI